MIRLNEPCSSQDLSTIAEFSRHLNALDRQARRPKDGMKIRMVTPKPTGCGLGLAYQLPGLTAVALTSRGDGSSQYEAAPCCEMRQRGLQPTFQSSGCRQRNLLGLYGSASWQEGVREPIRAGGQEKRLVQYPCRLNGSIGSDRG